MKQSTGHLDYGSRRHAASPIKTGFSLIEILIVISIMAVVVGLTLVGANLYQKQAKVQRTRVVLQEAAGVETELRIQRGNEMLPEGTNGDITTFTAAANDYAATRQMLEGIDLYEPDSDPDPDPIMDAWGNELRYYRSHAGTGGFPKHPRPFFLSAGEDGEFGTPDDLNSFEVGQ